MKRVFTFVVTAKQIVLTVAAAFLFLVFCYYTIRFLNFRAQTAVKTDEGYVVLAENESGMHCIQPDYSSYLILPPANTIKVQVFKKGSRSASPVLSGITVSYEIMGNTTSADKTNFWEYAKDYGYDLPINVGITGNGLKGVFRLSTDGKYYVAGGIPVVPYNDGSTIRNPYQLARITVSDEKTGQILAISNNVVVPVSDEMNCASCHGGADADLNILKAHDRLSNTNLAGELQSGKRHKCSECHQDAATNEPGKEGVPPLSQAIHGFHADKMAGARSDPVCFSCHPGVSTQCYRGAMKAEGVSCVNSSCHGDMKNIAQTQAQGRKAWANQPDCGACHGEKYGNNPDTLYVNSYLLNPPAPEMKNLILCESCHNGPHAEWPSTQPLDNLLPESLQGEASFIKDCTVCHGGSGKMHIGKPS